MYVNKCLFSCSHDVCPLVLYVCCLPANLEAKVRNACTVDCKFIVGANLGEPVTILGHKFMFILNSEVFESMLSGHFLEASCTDINLPDDNPRAFRNLRLILYNLRDSRTEVDELNINDTIDLYKLCDKYMIRSIPKLCIEHLRKLMVDGIRSDLISIFGAAVELDDEELFDDAIKELKKFPFPLHSRYLNKLKPQAFMKYIVSNIIDVNTHLSIFKAIDTYLTDNNLIPQQLLDTKESTQKSATTSNEEQEDELLSEYRSLELLEKLLSYVNFAKIRIKDFVSGPGVSKLLTWQQKYHIISQMSADVKPTSIYLFKD
ncbi:uncharacterized protein isoform X2 [Musca autumnalis]|uniref:uncharacterized protein isoform X2 n=1 Tax=Musca autumnalis TaxID=221902 RepID=UPI003CF915CB